MNNNELTLVFTIIGAMGAICIPILIAMYPTLFPFLESLLLIH